MARYEIFAGSGVHEVDVTGKSLARADGDAYCLRDVGADAKKKQQVVVDSRLVTDDGLLEFVSAEGSEKVDVKISLPKLVDEAKVALVVDIGNTRSFAFLVDDIGETPAFQRLELKSHSSEDQRRGDSGVFDSFVALEDPCSGLLLDGFGLPDSIIRAGANASRLSFQTTLENPEPGRLWLSSPKRYFWQNDPARQDWHCFKVSQPGIATAQPLRKTELVGLVEKKMGFSTSEARLPAAAFMAFLVVELLEQAERQMNEPRVGNVAQTQRRAIRRVREMVVTYPSAWRGTELDLYRKCIQSGVDAFCEVRSLPSPTLHLDCDEASGVLLGFLSNESLKCPRGIARWIQTLKAPCNDVGCERRTLCPAGQAYDVVEGADITDDGLNSGESAKIRIAVIDIGGGTTDLSASAVTYVQHVGGGNLLVSPLIQDGVCVAGDELLRRLVGRVVIPILPLMVTGDPKKAGWRKLLDYLFAAGTLPDDPALATRLTGIRWKYPRLLWAPLAIAIYSHFQSDAAGPFTLEAHGANLDERLEMFLDDVRKFTVELNDAELMEPLQIPYIKTDFKVRDIERFAGEIRQKCQEVTQEVFGSIATQYAKRISSGNTECDLVLLAGKTSQFTMVSSLFVDAIDEASGGRIRVQTIAGLPLAPQWKRVVGKDGVLEDVKMATVLGAAVRLLQAQKGGYFGANVEVQIDGNGAETYLWCTLNPGSNRYNIGQKIPVDGSHSFRLNTKSLCLGRVLQDSGTQDAVLAYELRSKSTRMADRVNVDATICEVRPGPKLELCDISGVITCQGRQRDAVLDDFELRPCLAREDDFWVDSGEISASGIDWSWLARPVGVNPAAAFVTPFRDLPPAQTGVPGLGGYSALEERVDAQQGVPAADAAAYLATEPVTSGSLPQAEQVPDAEHAEKPSVPPKPPEGESALAFRGLQQKLSGSLQGMLASKPKQKADPAAVVELMPNKGGASAKRVLQNTPATSQPVAAKPPVDEPATPPRKKNPPMDSTSP